jgi:hypothetical protein
MSILKPIEAELLAGRLVLELERGMNLMAHAKLIQNIIEQRDAQLLFYFREQSKKQLSRLYYTNQIHKDKVLKTCEKITLSKAVNLEDIFYSKDLIRAKAVVCNSNIVNTILT